MYLVRWASRLEVSKNGVILRNTSMGAPLVYLSQPFLYSPAFYIRTTFACPSDRLNPEIWNCR